MREQWPGKMAEYKSCCSNQSFSGLTITVLFRTKKQSFSGLPIIPKTINELCLLQTNPMLNITCTDRQTNTMLNITCTDGQTDKPHVKHNLYIQTDKQTNPMLNITCTDRQTDKPNAKYNLYRQTNRQTQC